MTTASPSCLPSCFLLLLLPSLVSAGRHSSLVRRLTGVSVRGGSLISSHIYHSSLLASHPSLSLTVCQDVGPVNKVLEVGDARANGVSNTSTLATRRQWTWAAQHTAHSTARPPCHTQRGQRCQFSSSCCNFHSVKTSLCVCVCVCGGCWCGSRYQLGSCRSSGAYSCGVASHHEHCASKLKHSSHQQRLPHRQCLCTHGRCKGVGDILFDGNKRDRSVLIAAATAAAVVGRCCVWWGLLPEPPAAV